MTRALAEWDRFWFAPTSSGAIALFRIAFGLLVVAWAITLLPNLTAFFGPAGVAGGRDEYALVYAALVVAALFVTVGYRTRLASAAVFAALIWFWWVNPYVLNGGDALIRWLALFVALSPAGAALSVDSIRRGIALGEFPEVRAWAFRLVQVQVSVIYFAAAAFKLAGESWRDGVAVHYPLHVPDIVRFPLPDFLVETSIGIHAITWGTIALELAIGILVWNRRARPWVLGAGAAFHLALEYSLDLGVFSWAMLVAYLAFLDPKWTERRLRVLAERPLIVTRSSPGTDSS